MNEQLRTDFRNAMAQVAAPVSVITTTVGGELFGATVSAFSSLSLHPPMVMVALDDRGSLVSQVVASGRFGLNILGAHQVRVAEIFAHHGDLTRFTKVAWAMEAGLPRIIDAPSWLACEVDRAIDGGDHTLFLGRVTHAQSNPSAPLNYHQRKYATVAELPASDAQRG